MGRQASTRTPTYLDEHRETVLNALRHATDLNRRESWETTFWVRSAADAQALQRMLRRTVFDLTGRMEQPVLAGIGLVRARRASDHAPSVTEEAWGVFVTVRPG